MTVVVVTVLKSGYDAGRRIGEVYLDILNRNIKNIRTRYPEHWATCYSRAYRRNVFTRDDCIVYAAHPSILRGGRHLEVQRMLPVR